MTESIPRVDDSGGVLDSWVIHLVVMLLGYATVFVPGYFLVQYFKNNKYNEKPSNSLVSRLIIACIFGKEDDLSSANPSASGSPSQTSSGGSNTSKQAMRLIVCICGLQVSYLTWGILQEKIMTKEYIDPLSPSHSGKFKDSQFLVFVNRILAFALSGLYLLVRHQPRHTAPFYKYSYCSFSNIMSSWCQYEALKFVSFPTQVLAKASKIIPVMIMGKIVSKKTYEYYEYVTALLISVGMTLFLMGSTTDKGKYADSTTISGVVILIGYMTFDSFTSNWQGQLFTTYKMTSMQMMCGVNFFSCLLTSVSLLQQGTFFHSLMFMGRFPSFMWDCVILSICSATGQLFIFYTINIFGPVIFVIIMTVRQGLAILLSCLIYSDRKSVV